MKEQSHSEDDPILATVRKNHQMEAADYQPETYGTSDVDVERLSFSE